MTGIFKANNPSGNAILFAYALAVKLPLFLHPSQPQLQQSDGVLYKALLHVIDPAARSFNLIYPTLTFLLLFLQAISFNRIVNNRRLHRQPNYLTGMSYLLVTSLFPTWFVFSAPLLVNSIMIWIWGKLCSLYNNPNPKAVIFNIGFATGLAIFIYFPSVLFLFLVMAGIAVARPARLQEWITGLVGIITPVYFFAAWLFLTDGIYTFNIPGFHFTYPKLGGNAIFYAAVVGALLATAAGVYYVNDNMRRQVVQTRKSWQLLLLYLVAAAVIPVLNAGMSFSSWILMAVPLSPVIAAGFFYPKKNLFPILLHWALFGIYVAGAFLKA